MYDNLLVLNVNIELVTNYQELDSSSITIPESSLIWPHINIFYRNLLK